MMQESDNNISEPLLIRLKEIRIDLEIREKHTPTTPLLAEMRELFKKLDVLNNQSTILTDQYRSQSASIREKARLTKINAAIASSIMQMALEEKFASNPSELTTSTTALRETQDAIAQSELETQTAQLRAIATEYVNNLESISQQESALAHKILNLETKIKEDEKLSRPPEAITFTLSPTQTSSVKPTPQDTQKKQLTRNQKRRIARKKLRHTN